MSSHLPLECRHPEDASELTHVSHLIRRSVLKFVRQPSYSNVSERWIQPFLPNVSSCHSHPFLENASMFACQPY
jgi:hypothetical protein